jgi:hypothetical protein
VQILAEEIKLFQGHHDKWDVSILFWGFSVMEKCFSLFETAKCIAKSCQQLYQTIGILKAL